MFSLLGLTVYLALEFLRPEVLFPGMTTPIMLWIALGTIVVAFLELCFGGWNWQALPTTRFFMAFVAIASVSLLLNFQSGAKALTNVQEVCKLFLIYLVIVQSVRTEGRLKYILAVFMGLILLLGAEGIAFSLGYEVPGFSWDRQHRVEYSGVFKDSNDLGQIFAVAWTLLVYFVINGNGALKKILSLPLLGLLVWAVLLTGSRGTMLSAIVGLSLAIHKRLGVAVSGAVAVSLLLVVSLAGVNRMNYFSPTETSAEDRVKAWGQGWYMLRAHPFFGVGPLNFNQYHPRAAHSALVQVGAETGLVGLFCWIGLLYAPLRQTVRSLWYRHAVVLADFRQLQLQAALLVCFVSSLFLSRAYKLPLYLLAAMVLAAARIGDEENEPADEEEAEAEASPMLGVREIALAQLACIVFWRVMIRHYINGI